MDEVGPLGAIELRDFGNCPPGPNEPIAAAPPTEWAQREAFVTDAIAMRAHACRDDDIETGIAGSARRRQTVRAKIPILRYEEEELWPPRRAGRRRPSRQVQRFCNNG